MRGVVINRVARNHRASVSVERFAGVRIRIEAGKVAARDIQPDAMASLEQISKSGTAEW